MKQKSLIIVLFMLAGFKQAESQVVRDTVISFYFNTGSYDLDSAQLAQLSATAASITSIKQITGYADRRGSKYFNLLLSQKRAETVSSAISSTKWQWTVKPSFKGESDAQHAELWKNRRVDIMATIQEQATSLTEASVRSINLDNIYFIPDSVVIAPQSLPLIKELAQGLLTSYPEKHFEIIGHANCQNTLEPSKIKIFYRLSEQRAKLIYLLLLEQGIPAERMSYKGIGNTQPAISSPQSVEEKKMNMRVEIIISQRG